MRDKINSLVSLSRYQWQQEKPQFQIIILFLAKCKQFHFFYYCGYIPKILEHSTSNSVENKNVTKSYPTGYEGHRKVVSLVTLLARPINSLNSSQILYF